MAEEVSGSYEHIVLVPLGSERHRCTCSPSRLSRSSYSLDEDEETTIENAPLIPPSSGRSRSKEGQTAAPESVRKRRRDVLTPDEQCRREHCEEPCCRLRRQPERDDFGSDTEEKHEATITCLCINKECNSDQTHCHGREVEGNVDRKARRKLMVVIVLVVVFMTAELLGWCLCVVFLRRVFGSSVASRRKTDR